jgi:hypothetical protein
MPPGADAGIHWLTCAAWVHAALVRPSSDPRDYERSFRVRLVEDRTLWPPPVGRPHAVWPDDGWFVGVLNGDDPPLPASYQRPLALAGPPTGEACLRIVDRRRRCSPTQRLRSALRPGISENSRSLSAEACCGKGRSRLDPIARDAGRSCGWHVGGVAAREPLGQFEESPGQHYFT